MKMYDDRIKYYGNDLVMPTVVCRLVCPVVRTCDDLLEVNDAEFVMQQLGIL